MAWTSSINMPTLVWLGLHMPSGAKRTNFFCLSITLLNGTVCKRKITIQPFKQRNTFDTSWQFVIVHPCSTCSALLGGIITKWWSWKYSQIGGFCLSRDTQQSNPNMIWHGRSSHTPNLSWSIKGGGYRSCPKFKIWSSLQIIVLHWRQYIPTEVKFGLVEYVGTLSCQIWPWLPIGWTEKLQSSKFSKTYIFLPPKYKVTVQFGTQVHSRMLNLATTGNSVGIVAPKSSESGENCAHFGVFALQQSQYIPIKVKFNVEKYITGPFMYTKFGPDQSGGHRSPHHSKFGENCSILAVYRPTAAKIYSDQIEIWHGRVYHGFTLAHQFRGLGCYGHPVDFAVTY